MLCQIGQVTNTTVIKFSEKSSGIHNIKCFYIKHIPASELNLEKPPLQTYNLADIFLMVVNYME